MFGRGFNLPQGRWQRIALGVALVLGGIVGFLPILGFWMIRSACLCCLWTSLPCDGCAAGSLFAFQNAVKKPTESSLHCHNSRL